MIVLMQCVAEAVMHKGIRGLAELVPGAPYLYDVAGDAVKRMKERKRTTDLRNEVLSTANATLDEVKKTAAEVARDVAASGPVEDRLALEMYLTQLPGAIRQSLKRPDDPSGKTVPADFQLDDATELLRRLPQRVAKFRVGDSLPGKSGWKLVEFLGSGGFGEVWLARNPTLTALQGAVKFGLDPAARERLLRHEGTLINRVMEHGRHPNVVPLIDAHLEGDVPWLMYEYVPGGDLGSLVLGWQWLPPAECTQRVLAALRTLAAAVGHFHQLSPPIVHRDLKPANVLLAGDVLKIADFGIGGVAATAALALEASRKGSTHAIMSQLGGSYTPLYASPQQQRGEPPDPRDDVHALGVIGFQMLTGKLDATLGVDYAKTLRRLGVSEAFIELLGDCAAHDPENRLRDATELATRLEALSRDPLPAPKPATFHAALNVVEPVALPVRKAPSYELEERERQAKRKADAIAAMAASTAATQQTWWTTRKLLFLVIIGAQIMVVAIVAMALMLSPKPNDPRLIPPPQVATPQRKTAEFVRAIKIPTAKFGALRISPEGKSVAVGGQTDNGNAFLAIADLSQTSPKVRLDFDADTSTAAFGFSPDSQRLVVATPAGAKVVSASNGSKLFDVPMPAFDLRGAEVLDRVVERLIFPLKVPDVYQRQSWSDRIRQKAPVLNLRPSWVGYSPDGESVLIATGQVFVRNIATPGGGGTTLTNSDGTELRVDWKSQFLFDLPTATAKHLAIVRPNSPPTIFDATSGKFQFELGTKATRLAAFGENGATLTTWDGTDVTRWSMSTYAEIHTTTAAIGEPVQLLFAGNGRRIVAVGSDEAVAFDPQGPEQMLRLDHGAKITRAALNPAGTVLATVANNGAIRIRVLSELASQDRADEVVGHTGRIHDIQFTPDGNHLIAVGTDGVFVWAVLNPKSTK